jgi:hypothetical protein
MRGGQTDRVKPVPLTAQDPLGAPSRRRRTALLGIAAILFQALLFG